MRVGKTQLFQRNKCCESIYSKALQPPAFPRGQLSDHAVVDLAVRVGHDQHEPAVDLALRYSLPQFSHRAMTTFLDKLEFKYIHCPQRIAYLICLASMLYSCCHFYNHLFVVCQIRLIVLKFHSYLRLKYQTNIPAQAENFYLLQSRELSMQRQILYMKLGNQHLSR